MCTLLLWSKSFIVLKLLISKDFSSTVSYTCKLVLAKTITSVRYCCGKTRSHDFKLVISEHILFLYYCKLLMFICCYKKITCVKYCCSNTSLFYYYIVLTSFRVFSALNQLLTRKRNNSIVQGLWHSGRTLDSQSYDLGFKPFHCWKTGKKTIFNFDHLAPSKLVRFLCTKLVLLKRGSLLVAGNSIDI